MKWISLASAGWHVYGLLGFTILFTLTGCGKDSKSTSLQSTPTAVITFSNLPSYDYGIRDVGSVWDHTFTLTNAGSVKATEITSSFYLSLSFGFKGGEFPGTGGNCPTVLNPQDSCSVVVTYSPKFSGPAQSMLVISYHNGTAAVTGNGPVLSGQGN